MGEKPSFIDTEFGNKEFTKDKLIYGTDV